MTDYILRESFDLPERAETNEATRVLFVSIAFPPKADSEALQVAKYFHFLQRHEDLTIDVVTSAIPTLYMPYDRSLERYAKGVSQLISLPLRERKVVNQLRSRLGLQELVFPDSKENFHLQYRRVLNELNHKPDIIYSRSQPFSSAILAYKLKAELGVPWIMHLSDPWVDCPMHSYSKKYHELNERWERDCFDAADMIALTAIRQVEFYKKKYPVHSEKIRFYPNVYDLSESTESCLLHPEDDRKKLRIVYTGGLAKPRSPESFLKALEEISSEDSSLLADVEVLFAGPADRLNRDIFGKCKLPLVRYLGTLTFSESLALQRSAHYLLALDFPVYDGSKAMYFLSKLLDYMLARRRILALTTTGGEVDRVIQEIGGDSCDQRNIESIKLHLKAAIAAFKGGNLAYFDKDDPPLQYDVSVNAERLYRDIISIASTQRSNVSVDKVVPRRDIDSPSEQPNSRLGLKNRRRTRRVAILSYGTGNLASLSDALEAAGATSTVSRSARELTGVDALVLPGVGHFEHALKYFRSSGLLEPALELIRNGVPTLGICLGFQLLTHASEEAEGQDGLAVLPCTTTRIRPADASMHKVPHLGWNAIDSAQGAPILLEGIAPEDRLFYYANAYAVRAEPPLALPHATFAHGAPYLALVEQGTVFGVQFHPEKSRSQGLRLLSNFLAV